MTKFIRLINTIKYLKFIQIYYRLYYFIRAKVRKLIGFKYNSSNNPKSNNLKLLSSTVAYDSYEDNKFTFLNLSKEFNNNIDWNYSEFGKLWTYNLSYFDFLHQKDMTKDNGLKLIYNFIENDTLLKDAKEPFPISLRGINWIKFLTKHKIHDNIVDSNLYNHYIMLLDNLEYHLLGNHLLENGFSLLVGAYYFADEKLYVKAKKILEAELEEQVHIDGAHFELSPMYHQIMLFRVLDCINLVQNNSFKNQELLKLLTSKASIMLGWLQNITYKNGDIPLLNDSTNKIAPTTQQLFEYAKRLEIFTKDLKLSGSGYRKISKKRYECIVDIGNIGPDYIPGHAHSDTFNFEIYKDEKPFIVDTGLSTYETNTRRTEERSTTSHNTVEVNLKNQSEVWGGFRVAKRAKVIQVKEYSNIIESTHDGYKSEKILHTRKWQFEDNKIIIEDSLNENSNAIFRLHFHPSILKEDILLSIVCSNDISFKAYNYSSEFNTQIEAIAIEIAFEKNLKVEIKL